MDPISAAFASSFVGVESEQNWQGRDRAMATLTEDLGGAGDVTREALANSASLKAVLDPILKSTASLRTSLVMTACACVAAIATHVSPSTVEIHQDAIVKALLKLTGNAKKLVASSGATAMAALIHHVPYHPRTLQHFITLSTDKNAQVRSHCLLYIQALVTQVVVTEGRDDAFVRSGGLECLEKALKKSLADATPSVRETSRAVFEILDAYWPASGEALLNDLEPNTKKALMKSRNPVVVGAKTPVANKVSMQSIGKAATLGSSPASMKPSPRKAAAIPLPELAAAAENATSDLTPGQNIMAGLTSNDEVAVSEAMTHLGTSPPLSSEESQEIQQALVTLLNDPPSPKVIDSIINSLSIPTILSTSLLSTATLTTTLVSLLTGDAPTTIPNFQLSPPLQTLLTNHTDSMPPIDAFHFLTQALSFNSTGAFPAMKPRRPPSAGAPKPVSPPTGSVPAAAYVSKLLSTLVHTPDRSGPLRPVLEGDSAQIRALMISVTRLMSLKSTKKRCKDDLNEVVKFLYGCGDGGAVVRKFLDTIDFEVACEIRGVLGISEEGEDEEMMDVEVVVQPQTVVVERVESSGVSAGDESSDQMSDVRSRTPPPPVVDMSVIDFGGADESFDGQLNLADITFEGGLVEESFLFDKSDEKSEEVEVDHNMLRDTHREMIRDETPKAQKTFTLPRSVTSTPSAVSGGMVGLVSLADEEDHPESEHEDQSDQSSNLLIDFDASAVLPARTVDSITAAVSSTPEKSFSPINPDFSKWMMRFTSRDYSPGVLETLYCMANPQGGVSARAVDAESAVLLAQAVMRVVEEEEWEVVGKEIAGSADTALTSFMERMDVAVCYRTLVEILESDAFAAWKEDPGADEFQPHPHSSAFDYLGKVVRYRVGKEVAAPGWRVDAVLSLCAKEMGSKRVDARRSAVMCLVDIAEVWDMAEDNGFWSKMGGLLSPSQMHLLTSFCGGVN
ncbi:suppressor of tub2 mutation [Podochytrium sp. JEL0797]|nr:suppressor of tub2 mutation [Podochytrium sp. JEL0797]